LLCLQKTCNSFEVIKGSYKVSSKHSYQLKSLEVIGTMGTHFHMKW
jgi:hypothetical protein